MLQYVITSHARLLTNTFLPLLLLVMRENNALEGIHGLCTCLEVTYIVIIGYERK